MFSCKKGISLLVRIIKDSPYKVSGYREFVAEIHIYKEILNKTNIFNTKNIFGTRKNIFVFGVEIFFGYSSPLKNPYLSIYEVFRAIWALYEHFSACAKKLYFLMCFDPILKNNCYNYGCVHKLYFSAGTTAFAVTTKCHVIIFGALLHVSISINVHTLYIRNLFDEMQAYILFLDRVCNSYRVGNIKKLPG